MKTVISSLIHPTQTYCVPGRSIHDNTFLVRDIISCNKHLCDDFGLLFLDQAKAFDHVDHKYLFSVLKGMGFGET